MSSPKNACPHCGKEGWYVIYYGLPSKLCADEVCGAHWGFWARMTYWLPFNGFFFVYEKGQYWRSLKQWLVGL